MPIFEYECQDCGHRMEFLEKRAGAGRHTCEQCKSRNLQKMLSGFSVGRSVAPPICGMCPDGPCRDASCPPGCGLS
ncbi:MAG: zinc ribbon domain-containing protein [Phycisphaerae bacterium]|nr:zinc ribbon domain-containing protein [Phycisphaerae bacterium]